MADNETSYMGEGDREFYAPSWRAKMDYLNQMFSLKDVAYDDTKDYFIEEKEIALKHPTTKSLVKLTDEGYVDIFAGPTVGIRIDPTTNSINFFGDSINLLSKNINMATKPNGLAWNGYYFNPELYLEGPQERKQMIGGTKEYYHMTHEIDPKDRKLQWHRDDWNIQPMIPVQGRRRYSEGMTNLLKDLGLPTE